MADIEVLYETFLPIALRIAITIAGGAEAADIVAEATARMLARGPFLRAASPDYLIKTVWATHDAHERRNVSRSRCP